MSTEQVLPKGTRVEITDPEHEEFGAKGEVLEVLCSGVLVMFERSEAATFQTNQIAVLPQPDPTIGQLYDQMDSLVFEACDRFTIDKPCVDIRIFGGELTFVDIRWFGGGEPSGPDYTKGKTPQEAIRAMIDRLKDMLGHMPL